MLTPDQEADDFLAIADQFKLGRLDTESPHPLTSDLSTLANDDLPGAFEALKAVDLAALETLANRSGSLVPLAIAYRDTLATGRRIFFCGCGATGRLSISLERFATQGLLGEPLPGSAVLGFMAGGDAALVRSIESFEDHPEWGAKMLDELGFRDGDLLVATTEGGETPYVIGATRRAAEVSSNPPFFLYCNPDAPLAAAAQRSADVLADDRIHKINLAVGPMALTGSTRMQASTVLMAAAGWALAHRDQPDSITATAEAFSRLARSTDFTALAPFTELESHAYKQGEFLLYDPGETFAITVLTDTTERSPTFSLSPFENHDRPADRPSLSYLHLPGNADAAAAWQTVLGRTPNTLEWPGLIEKTGRATLLGFDFSNRLKPARAARTSNAPHHTFAVRPAGDGFALTLDGLAHTVPADGLGGFAQHLLLKMLLNAHSTLIMGRLGRYQGNLMTYVAPTNNKLIDRAARYVTELLDRQGVDDIPYETVVRQLFHDRVDLPPDQPIVLKTVANLLAGRA